MSLKLLNGIIFGLLATQIPSVDARNVPIIKCQDLSVDCPFPDVTVARSVLVKVPSKPTIDGLERRAGGRPKPKPKDPDVAGGSGGSGDSGSSQIAGTGGKSDPSQEKSGGPSDDQGGARSGGPSDNQGGGTSGGSSGDSPGTIAKGKPPSNQLDTPSVGRLPQGEGPPAVRNNNNMPAQTKDLMDRKGMNYRLEELRKDLEDERKIQDVNSKQFFFYSGTYPIDAVQNLRPLYAMRLRNPKGKLDHPTEADKAWAKKNLAAMNDFRKEPISQLDTVPKAIKTDKDLEGLDYYWAAQSKAYAQIAKGDAILAVRGERTINQAAAGDRASFWWTWEIAELTRNPNIENIKVILIDSKYKELHGLPDPAAIGEPFTIWSKGDPPLSFPADLDHQMRRPDTPLSYDDVYAGNTKAKEPEGWSEIKNNFEN